MNRKHTGFVSLSILALMVLAACASSPQRPSPPPETPNERQGGQGEQSARIVIVNGAKIGDDQLSALDYYGLRIRDGQYWYDTVSGAWGVPGTETLGFVQPGLNLGGPLDRDASNGTTGIMLNGRELPVLDLARLQMFTGLLPIGRYFLDGYGNFAIEGGPVVINIRNPPPSQQSQQSQQVRREGILSTWDKTGVAVIGGDVLIRDSP